MLNKLNNDDYWKFIENLIFTLAKTGHPLEPFPTYKPHTRWQKIRWKLIKIRWKIVKGFVKHKSPLDGKTRY